MKRRKSKAPTAAYRNSGQTDTFQGSFSMRGQPMRRFTTYTAVFVHFSDEPDPID
jgi:hypothetical protein